MLVLDPHYMHQMYHISVQEFTELVRLSNNWSDLARRCGQTGILRQSIRKTLKQKVVFLKLDTQHFTSMRARRAWIAKVLKQRVCVRWAGDAGILVDVGSGKCDVITAAEICTRRAWIATVLKQRVCVRWAGDVGILADVGSGQCG